MLYGIFQAARLLKIGLVLYILYQGSQLIGGVGPTLERVRSAIADPASAVDQVASLDVEQVADQVAHSSLAERLRASEFGKKFEVNLDAAKAQWDNLGTAHAATTPTRTMNPNQFKAQAAGTSYYSDLETPANK